MANTVILRRAIGAMELPDPQPSDQFFQGLDARLFEMLMKATKSQRSCREIRSARKFKGFKSCRVRMKKLKMEGQTGSQSTGRRGPAERLLDALRMARQAECSKNRFP